MRRRLLAFVGALATAFAVLVPVASATAGPASPASQASPSAERALSLSGSQFKAGYIISDDLFYMKDAMSASQIQAFLDAKIGHCSNSNCLNVYVAKTETRPNDRNICIGYTPDSDARERVSMIIYKVQQACGISAKAILVTLQKEQGLITHTGPTTGRLAAAMGWLCPDTAPCDGGGASLFRQIYGGAWQLKRYSYTPEPFGNYHVGTYKIKYHPNSSCGTKTVTIKNDATAALYNYTPYTPNSAALANLGGAAPPCGSYGNRNFWAYYYTWFGPPTDIPFNVARTPVITGEAAVGATLTAATGNWSPSPTFAYQWLRDGQPIAGATTKTYVLTEDDYEHTIAIQVTGTETGWVTEVKKSADFLFGLAFTTAATPTITGTVAYGTTLTGVPGMVTPEPDTVQYQWLRDGAVIPGANALQYTTGPGDRGFKISFRVTVTKDGYVLTARESATTPPLLDVLTPKVPYVRMPDDAPPTTGQLVEAVRGKWYGGDQELAESSFSYTWYRDGALINGQSGKTYLLRSADAGKKISVKVTGTLAGFMPASQTSAQTGAVGLLMAAQTPVIDGITAVGQTMTAVKGTWTAGTAFSYVWLRGTTPIDGATASTYVLAPADVGQTISVRVTGTKAGYTSKSLQSAATAAVSTDMVTAATPTITGTPTVGQTLTASPGAWGPDPVTLTYTWRRGAQIVQTGPSATYLLAAADGGTTLTVTVTGSKPGYATVSRTGAPTGVILKLLTGQAPYITAPAAGLGIGATLTATRGKWYAGTALLAETSFTYAWYRDGVKITGQTTKTYKTRSADLDKEITVIVTAKRTGYQTLALTSPPTAKVPQVPVKAMTTTVPLIDGTAGVGATLTATVSGWTSGAELTYQWFRGGTAIPDATAVSYSPVSADIDALLTVAVTGKKPGYADATRLSAPVGPVLEDVVLGPVPTVRVPDGGPLIGQTVEAIRGTWHAGDDELVESDFAYTWYRSGQLINNQSAKTYQLRTADVGETISVRVSASKTGYAGAASTSDDTETVLGTITPKTPSIRVPAAGALSGQTLEAVRGAWTAGTTTLAETAFSYAWYRDGVVINGQTAKTYKLRSADSGKSITVMVTATVPNYLIVSRTSAPVATRY